MKNSAIKKVLFAMVVLVLIACSTEYHVRKGNYYFDNIAYSSAIDHY